MFIYVVNNITYITCFSRAINKVHGLGDVIALGPVGRRAITPPTDMNFVYCTRKHVIFAI